MRIPSDLRRFWLPALTVAVLVCPHQAPAAAQEATPAPAPTPQPAGEEADPDRGVLDFFRKTEVVAFVDVYYSYNFNEPATGTPTRYRNFDGVHNQFSFALAEVALSKPATAGDRVGFRLDLDYGPVAETVNSFEPGTKSLENLQQAYVSYLAPVGSGLTLDAGKFVTALGAEVIESKDNWNYSRSWLFALAAPGYHMGMRLGYSPNDKIMLGGALVNGWNNVTDNNAGKSVYLQTILKPAGGLSLAANYMVGPEQTDNDADWRHVFDTTVAFAATPAFSVMGNYLYGRDGIEGDPVAWQGVALYAKAQVSPHVALVPRFEYYDDGDGFTTGVSQVLKALTLTGEIKHSHGLLLRLEYRGEWSDAAPFERHGVATDHQTTFTAGLVYAFGTRP